MRGKRCDLPSSLFFVFSLFSSLTFHATFLKMFLLFFFSYFSGCGFSASQFFQWPMPMAKWSPRQKPAQEPDKIFRASNKRHIETLEDSGSLERKKYRRESKLTPGMMDVTETWLESEPNLTLSDMKDQLRN